MEQFKTQNNDEKLIKKATLKVLIFRLFIEIFFWFGLLASSVYGLIVSLDENYKLEIILTIIFIIILFIIYFIFKIFIFKKRWKKFKNDFKNNENKKIEINQKTNLINPFIKNKYFWIYLWFVFWFLISGAVILSLILGTFDSLVDNMPLILSLLVPMFLSFIFYLSFFIKDHFNNKNA